MIRLSAEELRELRAVATTTGILGKPTFIHRVNWRGLYDRLVRHKLVTWMPFSDGSLGPHFRSVSLTPIGRALLADFLAEDDPEDADA